MADKEKEKPGFLSRLFGRKAESVPEPETVLPPEQDVAATETEVSVPEEPVEPEQLPEPEPENTEDLSAEAEAPAELAEIEVVFVSESVPESPEIPELPVIEDAIIIEVPEENVAGHDFEPVAPELIQPERKLSWWQRLTIGMRRTSSSIGERLTSLFTKRKLDAATIEDLEDILVQADLGVEAAMRITDRLSDGRFNKEIAPEEVKAVLAEEVEKSLAPVAKPLEIDRTKKPFVILMVGVNGSGKTTTIGKMAAKFRAQGLKLMLAAGDTFRAAAIEQLKVWGERNNVPVVASTQGADAAGLAFDALKKAGEEGVDVLMVDTAGRLQNKTGLMDELEKIVRVMKKIDPEAPHATLLVLDATVGQNALSQVELFTKVAGVTGLIMTKLDGTARGGILVAVADKFAVPVHFIGVGEGVDDLEPFEARDFARAIAGLEDA